MEPSEVADTVRRAAAGDKVAWEALIEGFSRMIWGVAIAHRLGPSDANEVAQTTWLRLLEHFDHIEHPERVGGWLAKTARNESLRMIRLRGRELPLGAEDGAVTWGTTATPTPEAVVLTRDRDRRLWSAFVRLDQRCQTLLRLAVLDQPPYAEVASRLSMPIGSIGPTRARCLDRLRRLLNGPGG